jgi:hypothetical protein
MNTQEKLRTLKQLASERYGARLAFSGAAFVIDGVRLYLSGEDCRTLCPAGLLEKLGRILDNEKKAATISETGSTASV